MEFFWFVFSCNQSEYRKIWTRKNSVFGHFSRSDVNVIRENPLLHLSEGKDNESEEKEMREK